MVAEARENLASIWWLVLLEGIAVLILGILLLSAPGMTLTTLIVFLGAYWLVDGIFSIIRIFLKDSDLHWGWLLARGILGILAGLLVLRHPLLATVFVPTVLVIILGIDGIIMGGLSLIQAFKGDGWWAGILGAIGIIFGLILLFNPLLGAAVLPWVLGILGIIGGIVLIVLSFQLRKALSMAAA